MTTPTNEIYRGTVTIHNISDNIVVGWLRADPTSNTDFHVYSKNTAEYLACEMWMIGFTDQIYANTVLELLKKTEAAGKQFCFINQIGYWSSQLHHEFEYFINNTYAGESIVGINDQQLVGGICLVNIDWWVAAGRPDPETDEFYIQAVDHGVRCWPDEVTKDFKFQEIKINNLHPSTPNYHRVMERMRENTLETEVFFCANTEDFSLRYEDTGVTTDTIITVAGGLSAVLMAYSNRMPAGSTIHVVDTSPLAIAMSKQIFENWDGTDYAGFINKLIAADGSIAAKLRGVRQLKAIDVAISGLDGFPQWFNSTFKTYNIYYTELNLMQYEPVKKLLIDVAGLGHDPDKILVRSSLPKQRRVDINFSNVYHYAPSAFYVNYDTRREIAVKVSRFIGRISASSTTEIRLNGGAIADYTPLLEMFPWRK
jgi:hypothetical protein